MPNPAELSPSAVEIPDPQLHEAVIARSASKAGEGVPCVRPGLDLSLADDPMPWTPYVTGGGVFFPKKGERAILGFPDEGDPVILQWWPKAGREPDVSF